MKFRHCPQEAHQNSCQKQALWWYSASLVVLIFGTTVSAWRYPGGYDWVYTVASALASQKHNPKGSVWFASALILSMMLLWPFVSTVRRGLGPSPPGAERFAIGALRFGLIFGIVLGCERLFFHDLSHRIYKGHEVLGLFAFFGLYFGVLGLLVQAMLRRHVYIFPVLLVSAPLLAIGVTQFWLYLDQRDLGWVDTAWREMGIPIWLSFAFWQWLAIGFLSLGLGLLALCWGLIGGTNTVRDKRSNDR